MPGIRTAFLVLILSTMFAAGAHALTYRDIRGKWCGGGLRYEFSKHALRVYFSDGTPTRHFEVTGYEYSNTELTLHWLNEGKKTRTIFAEFSTDDRHMGQQSFEKGPRRPFHRCR